MFSKTINKIKQKIKNNKFKTRLKQEKRKIFIDTTEKKDKFLKKRKHFTFSFPRIKNAFIKDNFKTVIISSIVLLLIVILLALFSPIFNIKKINIELYDDSQKLIDLNIAYKSIDYIRNKNIILLEKSEIQDQLINYQKNINRVNISRNIFNKEINIKIGSSKAIFYTIIN
jgi:cell division septal protein FtsQ